MIYALIKSNIVVSIETLDANSASALESQYTVMDITKITPQPQVGWTLSGGVLSGPPAVQNWKITPLAMRLRFQISEMLAIEQAAFGQATEALVLQDIMANNMVATYVDLSSSLTQAAVGTLVSYGLITSARANAILTTPPTANELYQGQ